MNNILETRTAVNTDLPTSSDLMKYQTDIERKKLQMAGIEFQGVMCSATGDDQSGLSAVFLKHALAKMVGQTFPDVHFRFENGNRLTLNANNIDALDAVWTPFRLSFFPPDAAA